MYGKIKITGRLVVRTGMHIGGNEAFSAIGAIDSPVVKDPFTGDSYAACKKHVRGY